jgi:hypothetical protein
LLGEPHRPFCSFATSITYGDDLSASLEEPIEYSIREGVKIVGGG